MNTGATAPVVTTMARLQPRAFIRLRRFVRVHPGDNWAPNYRGDRVLVTLHVNRETIEASVSIWGADDTGVEAGPLELGAGLDLYLRVARNTCPPWRSLLSSRWGFRVA